MQPLANNCPKLERLTLCQSLSMTDKEMKVIAQSCPNLRRLCVKACMRVTDLGIISLATGCPALQKLKIRRCTSVTQTSLDFLQVTIYALFLSILCLFSLVPPCPCPIDFLVPAHFHRVCFVYCPTICC